MTHYTSVFNNSCLRVPVDPVSKMPKSAYERKGKIHANQQCSIDSSSTCSVAAADVDKMKDFYRSIPDYNDINHLPTEEFYSTLKSLRDKKKVMLGLAIEFIDDCNGHDDKVLDNLLDTTEKNSRLTTGMIKTNKSQPSRLTRRKLSTGSKDTNDIKINYDTPKPAVRSKPLPKNVSETCLKRSAVKKSVDEDKQNDHDDLKIAPIKSNLEKSRNERPKRNHSACSISWNDAKFESRNEVDQKFDEFFDGKKYASPLSKVEVDDGDEFKTQSMPSSPLRSKRTGSPIRRRKSITVPKPFKMTER